MTRKNIFKGFLYGLLILGLITSLSSSASADSPLCNTTITADITLTGNLNCSGSGLIIGANNITIDGAGYSITGSNAGDGIYITGKNNTIIKNLNVYNFSNGIHIFMSSNNNTITNNTVNNNTLHGILLYAYSSSASSNNNAIINNTANNNGQYGIRLLFSSNNTLISNTANDNGQGGILLQDGSNNNTLISNIVNNNSWYDGITLQGSSNNTLINNTANDNYRFGILISYASSYNNLTNNTANDNYQAGIYLQNELTNYNILTSNTVNNNGGINSIYVEEAGIWISGTVSYGSPQHNTLVNNTANNNYEYGLYIYHTDDNTLMSNTANNNTIQGIYVGGDNNTLTSNTANNNGGINDSNIEEAGMWIYGLYNTLENNTANNNYEYGIYLYLFSNGTLASNTANDNGDGIYLEGSVYAAYPANYNTLTSNTANNNTYHGIYLYYAHYNNLTSNTANDNAYGIYLDHPKGNELNWNTVCGNSQYDLYYEYTYLPYPPSFGDNNKGNSSYNWDDNGTTGFTYNCTPTYCYTNDCAGTCTIKTGENCTCINEALNDTLCYKEVKLNSSVMNWTGTCIDNPGNFNNKTLNCRSYTIDGDDSYGMNDYGIYLNWKSKNIIRDCIITDFTYGIYLSFSSNNNMENNTINSNTKDGIRIYSESYFNNLTNNNITDNNDTGVYFDQLATNNNLTGNLICSNGLDINDSDSNSGGNNTCDTTSNWDDTGTTGCTHTCTTIPLCYTNDGAGTCTIKTGENCTCINEALNDTLCYKEVKLNSSVMNWTETCIDNPDNFNNKTLNCQGYVIDGDDSGGDYGIYLNGKSNNMIGNCIITEFYNGIYINNSNNNSLLENEISNNTGIGVYSQNSNSTIGSNYVCGNTIMDFNSSDWLMSSGDYNTCDNPDGWNDNETTGCTFLCTTPLCYTNDGAGTCTIKTGENCTCINEALNDTLCYKEVKLNSSVVNWTGTCIDDPRNFTNKILDCRGHTIDGDDSNDEDSGIAISWKSGNTIKNCVITGFYNGIYLRSSSNNSLTNNTANNNSQTGIYLGSSDNNNLTNNTANSNSLCIPNYNSMWRSTCSYYGSGEAACNNVDFCSWSRGRCGINWTKVIEYDYDESFACGAYNQTTCGLGSHACSWNGSACEYIGDEAVKNNCNQRSIDSCSEKNYCDITLGTGIYLYDSSDNNLAGNTADNNGDGIYLYDSSDNNLAGNTVRDNDFDGIYSYNSDSIMNSNLVCENTFNDFDSDNWTSSVGDDNTCDTPGGWDDDGTTGCTYACPVGVETSTNRGKAYFTVSSGVVENLAAVEESSLDEDGKPNLNFIYGFFRFNVTGVTPGDTVTVTIELPGNLPANSQYWKYGPNCNKSNITEWYQIPLGSNDGDNIITINLTDGGLGDDNCTPDGKIFDAGGSGSITIDSMLCGGSQQDAFNSGDSVCTFGNTTDTCDIYQCEHRDNYTDYNLSANCRLISKITGQFSNISVCLGGDANCTVNSGYDLILDCNQDGFYNESTDAIDDKNEVVGGIEGGFFIYPEAETLVLLAAGLITLLGFLRIKKKYKST